MPRGASGGMQERAGLRPDMTCLGKIIGGGMPLAAYGGRREIMRRSRRSVRSTKPERSAGTPSRSARGSRSSRSSTTRSTRGWSRTTARLEAGLRRAIEKTGVQACVQRVGSMITLFFTKGPVRSWDDAKRSDTARFG